MATPNQPNPPGGPQNIDPKQFAAGLKNLLDSQGIAISILINNAAINPKYTSENSGTVFSRVENLSLDDWNHQVSVGLTGAFICSKHFGSKMAINKSGVILNISSDLSVISPDQRLYKSSEKEEISQPVKPITYSVIKSGLVGMTKYLATYWSANGVRVNALSPGGIYEGQSEEFVKKITNLIPLGRMAKSSEYRSAVQFLCSDASSYMTGQNIVIDGGRSVW
jgi:NAD(P)-dependent dehydrogenase (short-subunit alcohol dehydrogenase family)